MAETDEKKQTPGETEKFRELTRPFLPILVMLWSEILEKTQHTCPSQAA